MFKNEPFTLHQVSNSAKIRLWRQTSLNGTNENEAIGRAEGGKFTAGLGLWGSITTFISSAPWTV